jgi:hypothetical protein
VKQPGTLVQHEGREYLLVEGGYDAASRAVILLARPGDPRVAADPAPRPVRWGSQGEWLPLARWSADGLRIPDERNAQSAAFAQGVFDAYVAGHKLPAVKAWAAKKGPGFASQCHVSLPMGLAAGCFEAEADAKALPEADRLVRIDNLAMFFTHLVREGYAGALWNGNRPVFFCVDDEGDLQFLRVSPAGSSVAMEILDEHDRWESYDGAEAVEFIDNREACDQRLVTALGATPPSGWPADGRLWSLGARGVPRIFSTTEGPNELRHAVLFSDEQAARDWGEERAPDAQAFAVDDLTAFLTGDAMQGNVAAFNPGGHRARSGLLWSDGERVVLDSFSGFWKVGGQQFEPIDVAAAEPEV